MGNYFRDNEDLLFYVKRHVDWDPLVRVTEHEHQTEGGPGSTEAALEFYEEVLDLFGTLAADEVAPKADAIDRKGVKLVDGETVAPPELDAIFARFKELGLHGLCLPRELGGQNAPLLLYFIAAELIGRADGSVMAHFSFHGGMAMAMLVFSIQEGTTTINHEKARIESTRFQGPIGEIARGEAWGAMDITEPDAGSDMARLKCRAEQDEKGNWFVTGQKIFITSGHAKYHFVIARTEAAKSETDPFAGLKGLSMFLVQAYEDLPDGTRKRFVTIDRLEEKLGGHGSTTAALTFDRSPAHLLGKRGEGFDLMLTLMNNARIGVGFESIGLCEDAYRTARAYAAERVSMGKTIDRHEMIADYLDEMDIDIIGLRALAMHGAYHEELGRKLELEATFRGAKGDLGGKKHRQEARRVTPLLKYIASEKAVEHARRCIQIHGGNGYIREYPAEKLLRDAIIFPIYEGTSQIQSLMAMRDALTAILKNPQAFVKRSAETRVRLVSSRDPVERRVARLELLGISALQYLVAKTAGDKVRSLRETSIGEWPKRFFKEWDPKRDFAYAMLHAERLTRLLTEIEIARLLLALGKQHEERRGLCERWLERSEPRCRALHDEITTTGARLLRKLAQQQPERIAAE